MTSLLERIKTFFNAFFSDLLYLDPLPKDDPSSAENKDL